MSMNLYLAPLQGFTDVNFRNAWHSHFDGVDGYYAPYIALGNDGEIKKSQWRDIIPERNDVLPVPQILPASAEEAIQLCEYIATTGAYSHININMGCPYPMVTNRGRGSGLLSQPELVNEILEALEQRFGDKFTFSVKMRTGIESAEEMASVIEVLNKHRLSSVIVHPRFAKQLYKGHADLEVFGMAYDLCKHPIIYNGDITTLEQYDALVARFPNVAGVMLGRGVLQNPLLPQQIKTRKAIEHDEKLELLSAFHDTLFRLNSESLSGDSHLLNKMKSYLPYFAYFNLDNKKAYKILKKSQSVRSYLERIGNLLS